jgi:hypothetical protein
LTICVGALAADGKAIVCVADKSVTYGDDISGEADASKIFQLPSGLVVMMSGDEPDCERYISKLSRNPDLGKSLPDLISYSETKYKETREELMAIRILMPNLIDKLSEESLKQGQVSTSRT